MAFHKLPIGIQDFPSLREDGFHYVDKTALVYKLVQEGRVYFLSRPRRFGKSLLCSTLGAYLEGRRELFAGLDLEKLETKWTVYPVLRLDLNPEKYDTRHSLEAILESQIVRWEALYGQPIDTTLSGRFRGVIERAHQTTGRRVAVIIDEYDKPLLATIDHHDLNREFRQILKAFFGVFKSSDAHLKFVFITGVTKFGQVSVFSDLNQLLDLTLHPDYATLCGITEAELVRDFPDELAELGRAQNLVPETCLAEVRRWYNGYRFEENAVGVYNPFSTLNLFQRKKFESFWFATGTPTFLVELLKKTDTDLREIEGIQLSAEDFADYRADPDRPIPVIYQSGYLTIKSYNPSWRRYTLGFPNDEVRYGFLHFVSPLYSSIPADKSGFYIGKFAEEISNGEVDAFLTRLKAFFADFPYELNDQSERHYQVVFYLVFALMGQFVKAEYHSALGRADAVVWTADTIYVFEFKLHGTAEQALAQIDAKGYLVPFTAAGQRLVKVGVEFDPAARNLGRWLVDPAFQRLTR